MKKTILIIVLATFCLNFKAFAQNNAQPPTNYIKGKVTDEQGQPLPGATVKIQNERTISITDKDGKFTLTNRPINSVLIVSFVGYQTTNFLIPSNSTSEIAIQLKADANSLNEVQV